MVCITIPKCSLHFQADWYLSTSKYDVTQRKAADHTSSPTTMKLTGARGHHRCTLGSVGGPVGPDQKQRDRRRYIRCHIHIVHTLYARIKHCFGRNANCSWSNLPRLYNCKSIGRSLEGPRRTTLPTGFSARQGRGLFLVGSKSGFAGKRCSRT